MKEVKLKKYLLIVFQIKKSKKYNKYQNEINSLPIAKETLIVNINLNDI